MADEARARPGGPALEGGEAVGDDTGAVRRGTRDGGTPEQAADRLVPAAGAELLQREELARQQARHLLDEHLVFAEPAARRVEQPRAIGNALGDDAVAGLAEDDVDGADEIFIAQAVA